MTMKFKKRIVAALYIQDGLTTQSLLMVTVFGCRVHR